MTKLKDDVNHSDMCYLKSQNFQEPERSMGHSSSLGGLFEQQCTLGVNKADCLCATSYIHFQCLTIFELSFDISLVSVILGLNFLDIFMIFWGRRQLVRPC